MLSNEYIAGFFDGEGCICLTPNGQCKVMITQKDPEILRLIQGQFGGGIYKKGNATGQYYHLQFSKKELMLAFLRAIQPYSVVKRGKIEIAIQFVELSQSNQSRKQGERGKYLPVDMSGRSALRTRFYCS